MKSKNPILPAVKARAGFPTSNLKSHSLLPNNVSGLWRGLSSRSHAYGFGGAFQIKINRASRSAFTLTEAVVAMAVVGIMLMSLYTGIASGFFTVRMTRENLRATQIMLEKMEVVRLCTWEQITNNSFIPKTFTAYYYTQTNGAGTNGLVYAGRMDIRQPPDGLINANYGKDLRVIWIEVKWNTGGIERTRQLNTYYSRYGMQNYVIN